MAHTDNNNLENFSVIPGGRYGTRSAISADARCRSRVRERVVKLLRKTARIGKDRALENIAAGVTNPTGETVKLMERLKQARTPFVDAWDVIIEPQVEALHRKYGREYETGEFKPPHAA